MNGSSTSHVGAERGRLLPAAAGCAAVTLALIGLILQAEAQTALSVEELLRGIKREFGGIEDYRADVNVRTEVPGLKTPPMDAVIYFKKPDRIHLEAKGFAMLPRDAVAFNPGAFTTEMYDAVLQGEESVSGIKCAKLKLLAKSDTMRLQRVMLFIDPARMLIMKMSTDPDRGSSADILLEYAHVRKRHFLPSRITIEMNAARTPRRGIARKPGAADGSGDGKAQDKARITMTYSNHIVNKGIPESVFTKETRK